MSKPRIVKFMESPTVEDKAKANEQGVILRRTGAHHDGDKAENFDYRVGDAPGAYGELPEYKGKLPPKDDEGEPSPEGKPIAKMTVPELKGALDEAGVSYDKKAKKKDLAALLEAAKS